MNNGEDVDEDDVVENITAWKRLTSSLGLTASMYDITIYSNYDHMFKQNLTILAEVDLSCL